MSQKLEQLKDSRSEFIENLLAAFERDHPEFIEHLKECGLDEEDVGGAFSFLTIEHR